MSSHARLDNAQTGELRRPPTELLIATIASSEIVIPDGKFAFLDGYTI
jgi:hypothetical protein